MHPYVYSKANTQDGFICRVTKKMSELTLVKPLH